VAFGPIGRRLSMRGGWTTRAPLTAFAGASGRGRISTCCTASRSNVWRQKFHVPAQDDEGLNALARFWHELPAWADVVGGLYQLKPRYMIAPLSNGHVALLVSMSKSLGLPWDMIFGADLFRHYKPDPETYLGAAALFGCAPGEVIMVASHPSDLAGAARYGLRTCYVSRKLEYGEGRIVEPVPTPGTFDLMIDGIDELTVLLR
jgi:2-haloalkanoic acid dehalogenase type II